MSPIDIKTKKATLYNKYITESIMKAVNTEYCGKFIVTLNMIEGGIAECKITHEEHITLDKLRPNRGK